VLPLRDPGAFHGAFWRLDGRNVIVLKQRTQSEARWLFDLLHELSHASRQPDLTDRTVIEVTEGPGTDEEEQECGLFAGDVMLDGRAEHLAAQCVTVARGNVRLLKSAVQQVAASDRVRVDALANYMAFRLSQQGQNWWGTAHNLQEIGADPWIAARDIALKYLDFGTLNEVDRSLLMRALLDCEDV
jgi:hypothetical protein